MVLLAPVEVGGFCCGESVTLGFAGLGAVGSFSAGGTLSAILASVFTDLSLVPAILITICLK